MVSITNNRYRSFSKKCDLTNIPLTFRAENGLSSSTCNGCRDAHQEINPHSAYLVHTDDETVQDRPSARHSPYFLETHRHQSLRVGLLVFFVLIGVPAPHRRLEAMGKGKRGNSDTGEAHDTPVLGSLAPRHTRCVGFVSRDPSNAVP